MSPTFIVSNLPCLKPALSPRRRQWVGFLPKEKGFTASSRCGPECFSAELDCITSNHLYWYKHLMHALAHIMVHILMDIMVHILVHLNWCIPWCIPYVSNGLVSNGLVSKRILHNVSLRLSFSAVRLCLKRMFIDFL